MDEEIKEKLQQTDEKLDKIYKSCEQTRKYFLWTMIISIVVIVLPLIGLLIVIPSFLSLFSGLGAGGDINSTLDALGI
jgi:type II secretory pathway component PulF